MPFKVSGYSGRKQGNMEYKNILFNVEEEIATVTFNRPKVLNAMNFEVMSELLDAATVCEKDENIKVLILTGAGTGHSWPGRTLRRCRTAQHWKFKK